MTSQDTAALTPIENYLRILLPLYWLRPESALWYAHEFNAVRKVLGDTVTQPALEFGCLDGVNTFVLLGGEFTFTFDLYGGVKARTSDSADAAHDYFDAATPPESGDILARPGSSFQYGLDYKPAHLAKAAALGTYGATVLHSLNEPMSQFEAGSLSTIWAPMLFWVSSERLSKTLGDFRRILHAGGRIVTMVPDESIASWLVRTRAAGASPSWVATLDRDKHAHFTRNSRSLEDWEKTFAGAGLAVTSHQVFAPPPVVQIYDVGLRPMFPALVKMYDLLKRHAPDDVMDIKRHWVDVCSHFLQPLCTQAILDAGHDAATWHAFELRPRS